MKSVVEIEIDGPRDRIAGLFADPANNPRWMQELARCEPLSGSLGTTGSTYRMVPKAGDMVFIATIVTRNLPDELRLRLDGKSVIVSITDRFSVTSDGATRLQSVEEFQFTSLIGRLFGLFAQRSIRRAHRNHMESFKAFAERS